MSSSTRAPGMRCCGSGSSSGAATFAAFSIGRALGGDVAQTMAFATLALSELALVYTMRSYSTPAWRMPRNRWLDLSVLASIGVIAGVVFLPAARAPFATAPLGASAIAIVVVLSLVPLCIVELLKAYRRRNRPASGPPRGRRPLDSRYSRRHARHPHCAPVSLATGLHALRISARAARAPARSRSTGRTRAPAAAADAVRDPVHQPRGARGRGRPQQSLAEPAHGHAVRDGARRALRRGGPPDGDDGRRRARARRSSSSSTPRARWRRPTLCRRGSLRRRRRSTASSTGCRDPSASGSSPSRTSRRCSFRPPPITDGCGTASTCSRSAAAPQSATLSRARSRSAARSFPPPGRPRRSCSSPTGRRRAERSPRSRGARRARRANMPVYTIALGTDNATTELRTIDERKQISIAPPDRDTLAQDRDDDVRRLLRRADRGPAGDDLRRPRRRGGHRRTARAS